MNQQAQAIPLLKSNEEQLSRMCRRLEEMFRNLDLIHDLMTVCAHAVTGETGCGSEAAHCLELIGGNRLYGQMKILTNIIERLGGTTDFTEREPPTSASTGRESKSDHSDGGGDGKRSEAAA